MIDFDNDHNDYQNNRSEIAGANNGFLPVNEQIKMIEDMYRGRDELRAFGLNLINGRVSLLPIRLAGGYDREIFLDYSSPSTPGIDPYYKYYWRRTTKEDVTDLGIEVMTTPAARGKFSLNLDRKTLSDFCSRKAADKGLMNFDFQLIGETPATKLLVCGGGVIFIRLKGGDNALIVINPDGLITDILSPADYYAEKNFGLAVREVEEKRRKEMLSEEGEEVFEKLSGAMKAFGAGRMAHQRKEGEYGGLRAQVASLLGRPTEKVLFNYIDVTGTFNAFMNADLSKIIRAKNGENTYVPPLVFK